MGWVRRTLKISDIRHGHTPDVRSENRKAEAKGKTPPPIHVKPRGGKYRVHNGNDRLYFARKRGDTYIDAYVLENEPAKSKRKNLGFGLYWE